MYSVVFSAKCLCVIHTLNLSLSVWFLDYVSALSISIKYIPAFRFLIIIMSYLFRTTVSISDETTTAIATLKLNQGGNTLVCQLATWKKYNNIVVLCSVSVQ